MSISSKLFNRKFDFTVRKKSNEFLFKFFPCFQKSKNRQHSQMNYPKRSFSKKWYFTQSFLCINNRMKKEYFSECNIFFEQVLCKTNNFAKDIKFLRKTVFEIQIFENFYEIFFEQTNDTK